MNCQARAPEALRKQLEALFTLHGLNENIDLLPAPGQSICHIEPFHAPLSDPPANGG
jgi:hypothetical protein